MTKHGKHDHHGKQEPRQTPALDRETLERKTETEKVADGDPVAVIGTEVSKVGEAQQLPANPALQAGQEAPAKEPTAEPAKSEHPVAEEAKEPEPKPPRTDHLDGEGKPVYMHEFGACLILALGHDKLPDKEPENLDLIPFELASFFRSDPLAPDNAGLMHLKLKLKTDLLPDEDPRRVELAVKLFRAALAGLEAIEKEDGEKERLARDAAAFKPAHDRLDGDGPFDKDQGRLEKSDLGKSLDKQKA